MKPSSNNLIEFARSDEALLGWAAWLGVSVTEVSRALSGKLREVAPTIARYWNVAPDENALGGPFYEAPLDDMFHSMGKRWGLKPTAFWPEGRPYALCITHDMDRLLSTIQRGKYQAKNPLRAIKTVLEDSWTALSRSRWGKNPFFNFDRMLALQKELGYPSALYVLFEKRRWMMALRNREPQHVIGVYQPSWIASELKQFADAGNEIGIHASFDSYCRDSLIAEEKKELNSWGIRVHGVRNHYLKFDPVLSARASQLAGLRYDSTLGLNFSNGFRMGTAFPFMRHGMWELPFQLMDTALRHQFATQTERQHCIDEIQSTVRRVGGVLVVNWHTHVMNSETFPEVVADLARLVQTAKRDGAWLARPVDVIRWWEQRAYLSPACETRDAAVQ